MSERIKKLHEMIRSKEHEQFRQDLELNIADKYSDRGYSYMKRTAQRVQDILEAEKPVILPDEMIIVMRTVKKVPSIYTKADLEELARQNGTLDNSYSEGFSQIFNVSNISSDFFTILENGLEERIKTAEGSLGNYKEEPEKVEFLESSIQTMKAVIAFSGKYAEEAEKQNRNDLAEILRNVPQKGAKTFQEALQSLRILHYTLWVAGHYHCGLGRFDQYMLPFLEEDIKEKRLDEEGARELVQEFFLNMNKDTDLYPGEQIGDNGQSVMLGGTTRDGKNAENMLTFICLQASLDLKMIDPKINLRIRKDTDQALLQLGTKLTAAGLGFPQYSNDDVVIPGLTAKGYDLEDARDYIVAACWEFIIPEKGFDIPNVDAVSFMKAVEDAVHGSLRSASTYDEFEKKVFENITDQAGAIVADKQEMIIEPAPYHSALMKNCLETGKDISKGAKYNNYGIHGTGIASAADSMAAVKRFVFEEKKITKDDLLKALESNFEGYPKIYNMLKNKAPKMGNDDDFVDSIAVELSNCFADALEGKTNASGGVFRAGFGSAMYYIWHARDLGAGPDGRKKGEPLSANYSPSLGLKGKGLISVLKSFAKPDLKRIINGGPLTIELHSSVFRNEESIDKVAQMVKYYMDINGQQIQLNALNRDELLAAQKDPEKYKDMIVRVWGWSGYFCELDKEFQDHIIARTEYDT